jgi:carbon monoxide dehydrogenase subunit G
MEFNGAFELDDTTTEEVWLALSDGVAVDWRTEADVFGRVAQMGQRVVNPVANQVVKRFFSTVQQELRGLETADWGGKTDERSLTDRLLGRSRGDKT